jgi:hypothetical protein
MQLFDYPAPTTTAARRSILRIDRTCWTNFSCLFLVVAEKSSRTLVSRSIRKTSNEARTSSYRVRGRSITGLIAFEYRFVIERATSWRMEIPMPRTGLRSFTSPDYWPTRAGSFTT